MKNTEFGPDDQHARGVGPGERRDEQKIGLPEERSVERQEVIVYGLSIGKARVVDI